MSYKRRIVVAQCGFQSALPTTATAAISRASSRMAGNTVGDIGHPLLLMPADDLRFVMHVAAGVARPAGEAVGVAVITAACTPVC